MLHESKYVWNENQVQCSQTVANRMANNRRNTERHVNNYDIYAVDRARENGGARNNIIFPFVKHSYALIQQFKVKGR